LRWTRSACIPADNHDAASLHVLKVACKAADWSAVGSIRTFTTCFTPATVSGRTDNSGPQHAPVGADQYRHRMPRYHRELELDMHRARSTVYTLHTDLLFVTKYRRPVVTDPMLTCCEHLMREVCTGVGAALREFNGETDHVHLPVYYPPSLGLSILATRLKGVSARRLRQQYPVHIQKYLWGKHFWSPSYFAAYCDGAPLTVTKQYIEHQNCPD
jgi:putative transposase